MGRRAWPREGSARPEALETPGTARAAPSVRDPTPPPDPRPRGRGPGSQPIAGGPFGQSRGARPHAPPPGGSSYARRVAPRASLTKLGAARLLPARTPAPRPAAHLRIPLRRVGEGDVALWAGRDWRSGALGFRFLGRLSTIPARTPSACGFQVLPALGSQEAEGLEVCTGHCGPGRRLGFDLALQLLHLAYSPNLPPRSACWAPYALAPPHLWC